MSQSFLISRDEAFGDESLRDLHAQTVRVAIYAVLALSVALLAVSVIGSNQLDERFFGVIVALVIVAGCAHWAYRHSASSAATCLIIGLAVVFVLAFYVLRSDLVAPWFSIVVLITCALVGWRWGTGLTVITMCALFIAAARGASLLPLEFATNATLLGSVSLFISWLISRPTRTALEWAARSYLQELALVQEARERQAELASLSKNLGESNYLLEQLNIELDQARRSAHQARQLKEQFAAAVSHELRTPLNVIIGFCEMMVLSPIKAYGKLLPPNYRDDLDAIYRNAVHISTLVDDILDLSQVDADRMALHREWVPVRDVVLQAIAPVSALFRNRGLELDAQLGDDLPMVFVDATRIRQIVINLLANAARFTERGTVTIRARPEANGIVVSITDTGPGIPADELRYVFDEFRKVHDSTTRGHGSGLGLAVSRRFAEMHDGFISVDSEVGQGSTFALHLPVDPPITPLDSARIWDDRLGQRVRGTAERLVLVVNESKELERLLVRYLDGYRVVSLADVHWNDERFVNVLHGVVVGSDRDREHWLSFSSQSPRLRRLPMFSCSVQTGHDLVDRVGVNEYLYKPLTREQLRLALRRQGCAPKKATTVLVVDDDHEILHLLTRMLKSISRRYQIVTADDGDKALSILRDHQPNCVLLDLLLPTIDGYRVIEAMRENPKLRGIPVLVITAKGVQRESIVVTKLHIEREGGLKVAEGMRLLKVGLDSLAASEPNAPVLTAETTA